MQILFQTKVIVNRYAATSQESWKALDDTGEVKLKSHSNVKVEYGILTRRKEHVESKELEFGIQKHYNIVKRIFSVFRENKKCWFSVYFRV